MTPTRLRTATLALLFVGAISTVALFALEGGAPRALPTSGLRYVAWGLFPYAALAVGTARLWSRRARLAGLAGAVPLVLGGAALYVQTLYLFPDSQSGFVVVLVPVLQLAVTLLTVGLAWMLHRRRPA